MGLKDPTSVQAMQLLEGGVGIMFAFPSLCSFFILVLNNIAAELLARESACDTQLLLD